ncbi:MAG: GspH/FimT family pseudopilin [Chromatiales bacterium]|nr:GspH/FimT family pseudopilin [Chromatiales bacterium]
MSHSSPALYCGNYRIYFTEMKRVMGFTLVELMIVLLVAAVALGLGVPSFNRLIQNNRITTHANELVGTLHFARSEANKRGIPVSLCGSDDGASCNGTSQWKDGWVVFVDADGDGALDTSDADTDDEEQDNKVLRVVGALKGNASLTGETRVTYVATGQVVAAANLELTISASGTNLVRCISVSLVGRVSSTAEACPAP